MGVHLVLNLYFRSAENCPFLAVEKQRKNIPSCLLPWILLFYSSSNVSQKNIRADTCGTELTIKGTDFLPPPQGCNVLPLLPCVVRAVSEKLPSMLFVYSTVSIRPTVQLRSSRDMHVGTQSPIREGAIMLSRY